MRGDGGAGDVDGTVGEQRQERVEVLAHVPRRPVVREAIRALDRRAWLSKFVGEVANLAGDRAPAATHTRLRYARLIARRRLLVDHERERHELGEQLLNRSERFLAGVHHA